MPRLSPSPARSITGYWDRVQWPLQSLYFLLPLLIAYEIGTSQYRPTGDQLPPILAESLLAKFFDAFGGFGLSLPGLLVAGLLIFQHVAQPSKQPWKPEWRLQPFMWLESIALAVPLFAFAMVLFRKPGGAEEAQAVAMLAGASETVMPTWLSGVLLSIGAGIYEELLFRLISITVLHLILSDLLKIRSDRAMWLAVGISAVAFALYHFNQPELTEIREFVWARWGQMIFYTLAGTYFGLIYALRGFGVVVVTHALYDTMYITLVARALGLPFFSVN